MRAAGSPRMLCCARAALVLFAIASPPLRAQTHGLRLSARLGVADPSFEYHSECGQGSLGVGLDVQGNRRVFPQLSLDRFLGPLPGGTGCVFPSDLGVFVGGLRLENGTRVGLGVGTRVRKSILELEAAALAGMHTGRRGYERVGMTSRVVVPNARLQGSLVLFRTVLLSGSWGWSRLRSEVILPNGTATRRRTTWSPMVEIHVGLRLNVGR